MIARSVICTCRFYQLKKEEAGDREIAGLHVNAPNEPDVRMSLPEVPKYRGLNPKDVAYALVFEGERPVFQQDVVAHAANV